MATAVHRSKAVLERQLERNMDDCCFCQSLTKAAKVSTYTQTFVNWGLNGKLPKGCCVPVKAGWRFYCNALTCTKLHNPEANSDSQEARCKRCGLACLGTACCFSVICTVPTAGYVGSELLKGSSQLKTLQGPQAQAMR